MPLRRFQREAPSCSTPRPVPAPTPRRGTNTAGIRFRFTASDGSLTSNVATVGLVILPVNDPPAAQDLLLALDEDATASGALPASDVDNPSLSYVLAQPPDHGTVSLNAATGAFIYTPARDYNGPDRFRFTASDGEFASNVATVSLTIRPVNDPPVAQNLTLALDGARLRREPWLPRTWTVLRSPSSWRNRRTTERSR